MEYRRLSIRRVVVAGLISSCIALASPSSLALAADGDLDLSFDSDGSVTTPMSAGQDFLRDLAVQPDGKIVAVGYSSGGATEYAISRMNVDGSLDNSFSGDGKVSISPSTSDNRGRAVAIQSDGKIVVAGWSNNGVGTRGSVIRLKSDGSLDNEFDSDGMLVLTPTTATTIEEINHVFVQPDGKIVLVGRSRSTSGTYYSPLVVRLQSNGQVDFTTIINTTVDSNAYSGAIDTNGRIVIAGFKKPTSEDFAVWRLTATGTLDTTFSGDGELLESLSTSHDSARSMLIQPDGKIVLAGYAVSGSSEAAAFARITSDGVLDNTFGTNGTQIITRGDGVIIESVALQTDGKIVAAGFVNTSMNYDLLAIRLSNNGLADSSFGTGGIVQKSLGAGNDTGTSVTIQPDNKILVGGYSVISGSNDFALIRLNAVTSTSSLAALTITNASLAPSFSSSTNSYSSTVQNETNSVVVTPTATDRNATVKVNGIVVNYGASSAAIPLIVGVNTISVLLTAQDGATTSSYQVTITRSSSSNAALSSVAISGVSLTPSFSSSTTSYSATVSNGTKAVTVSSTVTDATATVKVNGTVVASGSTSSAIALSPGSNTISVVGTAQDGVTTKTYTFIITRDVATVKLKKTITAKSILGSKDISLASTSKVVIAVKTSSKKYCSVTGTKVKGVKKGSCTVVVSVTPKATKTVKKPKTTKTTVTIRVV